jgi:hypothetical protein
MGDYYAAAVLTGGVAGSVAFASCYLMLWSKTFRMPRWVALPSLNRTRCAHHAVIVAGRLFVAGGHAPDTAERTPKSSAECLDLESAIVAALGRLSAGALTFDSGQEGLVRPLAPASIATISGVPGSADHAVRDSVGWVILPPLPGARRGMDIAAAVPGEDGRVLLPFRSNFELPPDTERLLSIAPLDFEAGWSRHRWQSDSYSGPSSIEETADACDSFLSIPLP